jgi:hypothetical protein
MLSFLVDPGPVGAQARGNELGQLQASYKIVNSVVTTGSNNWYQSSWLEKLNLIKNHECHIYGGGTSMCD